MGHRALGCSLSWASEPSPETAGKEAAHLRRTRMEGQPQGEGLSLSKPRKSQAMWTVGHPASVLLFFKKQVT
jgi:hypothetical protein